VAAFEARLTVDEDQWRTASPQQRQHAQELPESVKQMVGSGLRDADERGDSEQPSEDLLPKATNASRELAASA
jgi:hypothetical protein